MPKVHYYLGRPARIWIAMSRRRPARPAHKANSHLAAIRLSVGRWTTEADIDSAAD
jgi:hypothetical protein